MNENFPICKVSAQSENWIECCQYLKLILIRAHLFKKFFSQPLKKKWAVWKLFPGTCPFGNFVSFSGFQAPLANLAMNKILINCLIKKATNKWASKTKVKVLRRTHSTTEQGEGIEHERMKTWERTDMKSSPSLSVGTGRWHVLARRHALDEAPWRGDFLLAHLADTGCPISFAGYGEINLPSDWSLYL